MRVTSRVSRLKRVGVGVLLLAGGCVLEGCAANKMTRLDDAPIRVKNQKLEAELLTADPTDVWDLAGTDFTPKNSTHPHATIMVYVSKYSGSHKDCKDSGQREEVQSPVSWCERQWHQGARIRRRSIRLPAIH